MTTLGSVLRVKHGFAFAGEEFSEDPRFPTVVTPGNFRIGGGFQSARPKTFSGEVPEGYVLSAGDLIITMTDLSKSADTLGSPALVPNRGVYLHNQRIGRVELTRPDLVSREYLAYRLRELDYRQFIVGSASGTTVRHTSPGRIETFRIELPSVATQRAIAEVLGALDDKIAANARLDACSTDLLEGEFRSIQRSAEAERTLGQLVELRYGRALTANLRVPGKVDVYGSGGIAGTHNEALCRAPGVVVGRKGTVGAVYWADRDFHPIDTVFYVVPRTGQALEYLYFLMRSLRLGELNSDSAVPGLNREEAYAQRVRVSSDHLVRQFAARARCLFSRAFQARVESQHLATLRDALLPHLMSGRITVRDAEKQVEEVL